jgi:hypothetical protein
MGVSCDGRPNWIGCDRVGLYVYLDGPVARLTASIGGREVPMHSARGGPDSRYNWEGFLQPQGSPFSVRFLVHYFETRKLTPFAIYCLIAGLVSLAHFA